MDLIPKDVENIILNYKCDIEHKEKMLKVCDELSRLLRVTPQEDLIKEDIFFKLAKIVHRQDKYIISEVVYSKNGVTVIKTESNYKCDGYIILKK
ncbi:hypothetical protein RFI_13610 [Reticulomyxa filosa]|uniref:Uncharacterized protein n=1 Tax=Reticulomyxa filosa TaxID=46433 RepID=X6NCE7_RETFI|nr:hypothetical protein RFI_13610 [Reticulomyxa filosa]|eukprot:ETO23573.1 hypothetical protein RFI_13610 [Reticulomyxa filosa]